MQLLSWRSQWTRCAKNTALVWPFTDKLGCHILWALGWHGKSRMETCHICLLFVFHFFFFFLETSKAFFGWIFFSARDIWNRQWFKGSVFQAIQCQGPSNCCVFGLGLNIWVFVLQKYRFEKKLGFFAVFKCVYVLFLRSWKIMIAVKQFDG